MLLLPDIIFEREEVDFRTFAIRRHKLQLYGNLPYSYHLAQVEQVLETSGFAEYKYKVSAWLHDLVEDTDTSIEEIHGFFGDEISAIVWACTGEGANRAEKQETIRNRISQYPDAAPVKVADRYCNILEGVTTKNADKLKMYLKEWEAFSSAVKEPMMLSYRHSYLYTALEDLVNYVRK